MLQAVTPIAPLRRGACPTLDAPMPTGDGLLARLRISGGRTSPGNLLALARLATLHGNGIVEVTARGNVQVRGLSGASAPLFAEAINDVWPIETGLVVDLSPIAGEDPDELADPRPIAQQILELGERFGGRLGPKVSVVVEGGGQVSLAALKADVRLSALAQDTWSLALGGREPVALSSEEAVAATAEFLGRLASLGPDARGADLFPHSIGPQRAERAGFICGSELRLRRGSTTAVALPFGASEAKNLEALAAATMAEGVETIRFAPGNGLLLDNASAELIALAEDLGFLTRSDDPRLRVRACIGSAGCASGRVDARRLASVLAPQLGRGQSLHVSGCSKGCAHPRTADLTLVGRDEDIGLVIAGRAGDRPEHILGEVELPAALARYREGR